MGYHGHEVLEGVPSTPYDGVVREIMEGRPGFNVPLDRAMPCADAVFFSVLGNTGRGLSANINCRSYIEDLVSDPERFVRRLMMFRAQGNPDEKKMDAAIESWKSFGDVQKRLAQKAFSSIGAKYFGKTMWYEKSIVRGGETVKGILLFRNTPAMTTSIELPLPGGNEYTVRFTDGFGGKSAEKTCGGRDAGALLVRYLAIVAGNANDDGDKVPRILKEEIGEFYSRYIRRWLGESESIYSSGVLSLLEKCGAFSR